MVVVEPTFQSAWMLSRLIKLFLKTAQPLQPLGSNFVPGAARP